MKLSVIIPVFNEKKNLLSILEKVQSADIGKIEKEIIIVDDFSIDGTREILKKIRDRNVVLAYHEKNYGKGRAIRTALEKITGDLVIIQDADLEYDPQNYMSLIKPILEKKAEVVYGSRNLGKNEHSYLSFYLGGKFVTFIANMLYGLDITDEATCYKVFKKETLTSLNLECERFEFCPEVTAKIAKKGIKILEVPIDYYPRKKSEGKKIRWKDGLEAIWVLCKYKFKE